MVLTLEVSDSGKITGSNCRDYDMRLIQKLADFSKNNSSLYRKGLCAFACVFIRVPVCSFVCAFACFSSIQQSLPDRSLISRGKSRSTSEVSFDSLPHWK